MKIFLLLALIGIALCQESSYDWELFENEIDGKCLSRLWTHKSGPQNMHPGGQTLESFISMVEKVEARHTEWDIYQVSKALLKRFAFEGVTFQKFGDKRMPKQLHSALIRWDIIRKLVGDDVEDLHLEEDIMSDEEECTMFFMMGHLINNTFRPDFDSDDLLSADVPQDAPPHPGVQFSDSRASKVKQPREQGVVSVGGNKYQAISISKVLNGILASRNEQEPYISQLYGITAKGFPTEKKINPLIGVTLADVVTLAGITPGSSGASFYGPGGYWNSTTCPTEYTLNNEIGIEGSTNALLRGAADGLLVGKVIQSLSGTSGLLLSRVLRMYYSKYGLPSTNSIERAVSYCNRGDVLGIIGQSIIEESATSFYYTYYYKQMSTISGLKEDVIKTAISNLANALNNEATVPDECRDKDATVDNPVCETPSNVFIVLDSSEKQSQGYAEQEEVVGFIASSLDFGHGSGSLSVFHDRGNNAVLEPVKYNATDPTCAACLTERIDQTKLSSRSESEVSILEYLNKTLQSFERVTDLQPGVPNKVAIMFRFDDFKETQKGKLTAIAKLLREGHRDTRVIAVGSNREALSLITKAEHVVTDISDAGKLANDLVKRICRVPAIFQFNRCFDHKKSTRNEDKNVYTGFVTNGHVQFWAFYPEYFHKSYTMKIKFRTESGSVNVCEQRGVENPGFDNSFNFKKDKCKSTADNGGEVSFSFSNPCEDYSVHDCPPIYFSVIGDKKNSIAVGCPADDKKCRRFDQIKFQMSHEGIYCSGCDLLKSTPIFLLISFLFYCFKSS